MLFTVDPQITYAMSPDAEQMLDLIQRKQDKLEYFHQQVKAADAEFKEALMHNFPDEIKQERLEAKKDSETNYNLESKVLKVLKERMESGNYNTSLDQKSSLGKRNFEE